ncbi:MAG: hypothetical protein M1818_003519 [Claussenomyces sp. TS43310]|nr:MAG: hypothetical protein M1818_003519 [Claussenomyces sp. TS43310]
MVSSAGLTPTQLYATGVIERTCSSLSLTGCAFIILTFLASKGFQKPINRLVFYASIGNVMTNVATMIGVAALDNIDGALCQFQGFLIQTFLVADAFWTLAMALNVYLTFYYKFDAERLRSMEKWYLLVCYGLPFIPGFVFIWISQRNGVRVYGNASLWCWVSTDWDIMRIATFYGAVWVAIFLTFLIYIRAGREIYKRHKALRGFSNSFPERAPVPGNEATRLGKTTEVLVTSESINNHPIDLSTLGRHNTSVENPLYSVSVSTHPHVLIKSLSGSQTTLPLQAPTSKDLSHVVSNRTLPRLPNSEQPTRRHTAQEANTAAWSYTKVAILFFTAMLVTWIPSSANRVYSVVHPDSVSVPLVLASAFVLPLQGFWNAVIYLTTSWSACKTYYRHLFGREPKRQSMPMTHTFGKAKATRLSGDDTLDSDSLTELDPSPSIEVPRR